MRERTIRLDISYDGTNYAGWQIQDNAVTVESTLRQALEKLKIEYTNLAASGRTDSGVHAKALTISFKTLSTMSENAFKKALNSILPEDIVVNSSCETEKDFHARFSALGKHYSYRISLEDVVSPFEYRYTWKYPYKIDPKRVREICTFLEGRHDYRAFRKTGSSVKSTEREIYAIVPTFKEGSLILDFVGEGFLYNMVRILTGTILQYASGQLEEDKIKRVFSSGKREDAGITAPAKGLFLEKVFYTQKELEDRIASVKDGTFR